MNAESKQILTKLEREYNRGRYPNVPVHATARKEYEDHTANGLTRCIVDYIRFSGGFAERINRMGFRRKNKYGQEIWVSGGGTNGTADISAVLPGGRSARIEVKVGRDKIRSDQIRYAEKVIRAGALYFIARSFDEFLMWYETIRKQNG